ncbi:WD40 repeat-containing protein, putative [Bodo saltans]|uniref:WD40 repeat-containing protein, putative n=1 Tax=Bodo saltans TaxID=75058 RepID=A0A0S4JUG3_BODSA|nr:WD40 repeat-containing protein, putative [Bodo saltans]|eukprot:CUG93083.1 WD40 repeat-containing protein, putative [Bodo saltans]
MFGNASQLISAKEELIRLLSGALIKEPSFDSKDQHSWATHDDADSDASTVVSDLVEIKEAPTAGMMRLGALVSEGDGEFLLKLAVYLRQDLGIRGSANFLTSIAAYQPNCQPYLSTYLPRIIGLPTDWLQIASFARDSPLRTQCGLPTSLRNALTSSFKNFNEFSLAKYNTESAQKKRKKDRIAKGEDPDDIIMPYTLKQMVRLLHISEPRYEVMCLLGKNYPASPQEFSALGLETPQRVFDPTRINRRMRLAVPTTWETELAAKGNHAHVWDGLVKERKLPFMAMLRNLRNVILAGCARSTHDDLIGKLRSEDQIANSKQFPYRFFSAFDVLSIDPATAYDAPQVKREGAPTKAKPKPATAPTTEELTVLLQEYRDALQESVRLATKLNIRPIHGKSVVLLQGSLEMLDQVRAQGAKGIGSVRSKLDVAMLLAIMLQYACESCDFVLFIEGPRGEPSYHLLPPLDRNLGMLEALTATKERVEALIHAVEDDFEHKYLNFPFSYLDKVIHSQERIESVLLVSNGHVSYEHDNLYPALGSLKDYLQRLRVASNPDLLFVSLSIDGNADMGIDRVFNQPNDVLLTGFSDSILRFIAERSGGGPRQYIEHIHEVYNIDTSQVTGRAPPPTRAVGGKERRLEEPTDSTSSDDSDSDSCSDDDDVSEPRTTAKTVVAIIPPPQRHAVASYRVLRCFISSTFTDMHCERQALMSDVFPALRSWISKNGWKIHVTPIDFRWGILAEAGSGPLPTAASMCLAEVSRCSPFILGILGNRYGSVNTLKRQSLIPNDSDIDAEDFDWLAQFPGEGIGLSVTELELRHALQCTKRLKSANSSPKVVVLKRTIKGALPPKLVSSFADTSKDAQERSRKLLEYLQADTIGASVTSYCAAVSTQPNATEEDVLDMESFARVAIAQLKEQVLSAWPSLAQRDADSDLEEDDAAIVRDDDKEIVILKRRDSDTASSSTDDEDGTSSAFSCPSTVAGDMLQSTTAIDGAEDQTFFSLTLEAPYVPQKEAVRAAQRFLQREAVGASAVVEDDDVSAIGHGPAGAPVLLVHAEEGAGKSSFLAHIVGEVKARNAKGSKSPVATVAFSFQAAASSPIDCLRFIAASIIVQFDLSDTFTVPNNGDGDKDALSKLLPELYSACEKKLRTIKGMLLITIDGIDTIPSEIALGSLSLMVLPNAPPSLLFILSTYASSPVTIALKGRPQPTAFIKLPLLSLNERVQVVQRHLGTLSKTLQDSVTKGSMVRVLCRKTDAGLSSYLMLSLTYLALFSKFDTLKQDIRRLPGTLVQLQTDVLRRCEGLFTADATTSLFTTLALSQSIGGVTEEVLLTTSANGSEASHVARLLAFLKYHSMLSTGGNNLLSFTSDTLVKAARKRYLAKTAEVHRHHTRLLSQLLKGRKPQPSTSGGFPATSSKNVQGDAAADFGVDPEILRRLPVHSTLAVLHHSLECKRWGVVSQIGSSIDCIVTMVEAGLLPQLLVSIERLQVLHRPTHRKLQVFSEFLLAHRHILARRPSLAAQLALNMPTSSPVYKAAKGSRLDDDRTWVEWHNRHVHGERECTMTSQWTTQKVLCAAFSADGTRLAIGGADWVCRVGLILEGTIQHELKHTSDITAVAFAGTTDMTLVTGANDGMIRVWSLHDGAMLQEGKQHGRRVNDVAMFGKELNMCLSASDDTTLCLWRLHVGGAAGGAAARPRPLKTFRHHKAPVSCCAVHQSGQRMATGSWDGGVAVTKTNADKDNDGPQWLRLSCAIRCVAFVPSMVVTVAVGTFTGAVHLYDAAGEVLSASFHNHSHPISALHISHDAKYMLSTDASGRIKLWRQSVTGEIVGSLNGHDTNVPAARFHPKDSNQCITGSLDSTVRHWTFKEQGIEYPVGGVHDSAVTAMAAASNGAYVVTACRGGVAHVFASDQLAASAPWFSIAPHRHFESTSDDEELVRPTPLCYVTTCKDDTLIVLGDVFGTLSAWGSTPGLSGKDAPLRFLIRNALVHPAMFVWYHTSWDCWIALSYGGESRRWKVTNMEFATGNPDILWIDEKPHIDGAITAPLVTAMPAPDDVEPSDALKTIMIGTGTTLLSVKFGVDNLFASESMDFQFGGLGRAYFLDEDATLICTHVLFNAALMSMAYEGGYIGFVDMRAKEDENEEKSFGLVRLRDDRNPRQWMNITCFGLTTFDPYTRVAVGGSDMTIRLLNINPEKGRLDFLAIFHTTASPKSAIFHQHGLVCGDTLGNVYALTTHQSALDEAEEASTEVGESTEVTDLDTASLGSETESTTTSRGDSSVIDMFAELGTRMPAGCKGKDRAAWLKRQQELLRAATKLQRTVPAARVALRRHAQVAFTAFEAFSLL